jgi:hypothetical protein
MRNTWFLRLRTRLRRYKRKTFKGPDKLSDWRQLGFDIFKIALMDEGNIRYYDAPNGIHTSDIKYIISKEYFQGQHDVNTFIIFDYGINTNAKMIVVNHEYKYDFDFPLRTSAIMSDMFDDAVRKDRAKMREEIMSNVTNSLVIVLSALKQKMLETRQKNIEIKKEQEEKNRIKIESIKNKDQK